MLLKASDFFVKIVPCCFAMLWIGSTWAMPEKVCDNERALFQCQVRGGGDLALCPSYANGELSGIQYRFGREGKKEFFFPASGFDFKSFKSNHFVRYQVDYKTIKFSVDSYTYSLYSNYDGEEAEGVEKSAGVVISNSSETPDIQMPCAQIYVDNLKEVVNRVECDANDALGCK